MTSKNTIRTMIVDDERQSCENLRKHLNLLNIREIEIVAEASTVADAKDMLRQHQIDLLFLDIKLTDGSGFEVAEQLVDSETVIIFFTAYNEYAIKAFKVSAIDYLLKPIDIDLLENAIRNAIKIIEKQAYTKKLKHFLNNMKTTDTGKKKITLPTFGELVFVEINEIVYVQSENNYTKFVFTKRSPQVVSRTLGDYEKILASYNFFRVHQSYIINLQHIKSFLRKDGGTILTEGDYQIPVSRRKREAFLKLIGELY